MPYQFTNPDLKALYDAIVAGSYTPITNYALETGGNLEAANEALHGTLSGLSISDLSEQQLTQLQNIAERVLTSADSISVADLLYDSNDQITAADYLRLIKNDLNDGGSVAAYLNDLTVLLARHVRKGWSKDPVSPDGGTVTFEPFVSAAFADISDAIDDVKAQVQTVLYGLTSNDSYSDVNMTIAMDGTDYIAVAWLTVNT